MAYRFYGGSPSDYVTDAAGNVTTSAAFKVYTTRTGSTQPPLKDSGGSAVTTITPLAIGLQTGLVVFQADADAFDYLWLDRQDGSPRLRVDLREPTTIDDHLGITAAGSGGQNMKANPTVNLMGAGIGTANTITGGGTTTGTAAATPNLPAGSPYLNAILGTNSAGVNTISGGYDNVIDTTGAGAGTISGGAHHRILDKTAASGSHGAIGGGSFHTVKGNYSGVFSGTGNSVTDADYAVIAGGSSQTASGNNSGVTHGSGCIASGTWALAGGLNATASGANVSVALGRSVTASGTSATALGYEAQALNTESMATGRGSKTNSNGQWAHSSGYFAAIGDAQVTRMVVRRQSTDATTGSSTPNYQPPDGATVSYRFLVAARQTGGAAGTVGDSARWTVEGLIRRAGTTVTQVGTATVTKTHNDTGAAAWTVSVLPGTGTFVLRCTGEASKNIDWVAELVAVEAM